MTGKRRSAWTWPHRILLDLASLALSIPILWLAGIAFFMTRTDVNLDFVKPHYEHWFAEAFNGKSSRIDSYSARWLADKRLIEVQAHGVHILDRDGVEQTIEDVRGDFRIRTDKGIRPEIVGLSIKGGALILIRDENGRLQLGMGSPESWQKVGALWESSEQGQGLAGLQGLIEHIDVENARLFYLDKAHGFRLNLTDMNGRLLVGKDRLSVEIVGAVDLGEGEKAPLDILASADPDLKRIKADLVINNLVPNKLAAKHGPLRRLADFDMPVDINLQLKTNAHKQIEALSLDVTAGAGKIKAGQRFVPFSYSQILAGYDADHKRIDIPHFEIKSEKLEMMASGTVRNNAPIDANFVNRKNRFDIRIDHAVLNPKRMFAQPLRIKSGHIKGQADLRLRAVDLDIAKLDLGNFGTDIKTRIRRTAKGRLVSLKIDGGLTGQLSTAELVQIWPTKALKGTRLWVKTRIKAGTLENVRIHTNLDKTDFTTKRPSPEHLRLGFELNGANVKFMKSMPAMENVSATGLLQGNRFDITISGGDLAGIRIVSGQVNMPKLSPNDGDFTIDLVGVGRVSDMLKISDYKPFFVAHRAHLDPDSVAGQGQVTLHVKRPLKKVRRRDQVSYTIDGHFDDVALLTKRDGLPLHRGRIDLHADNHIVTMKGPLQLGHWPAQLNWHKKLGKDAPPASYTLKGVIDRAVLDQYGIGLRRYFGGKLALTITGKGDNPSVKQVDLLVDFKAANLNFGQNWVKPEGEPGTLTTRMQFVPEGGFVMQDLQVQAEGLDLRGQLALGRNFRLKLLDLKQARIEGLIDAALKAGTLPDGRLAVDMDGRFLNIEYPVAQAFHFNGQKTAVPIKIDGQFDSLKLAENYSLRSARLEFDRLADMVKSAHITGQSANGDFVASIVSPALGASRKVKVRVPDASKAIFALLGMGNIKGGQLSIDGTLPPRGEKGGLQGEFTLDKFTLIRAPAFAQILSLASLTGLADTLSGGGMEFNTMNMQFSWMDGVLKIREGRASGPALGLTGEGDIDIRRKYVDFSGVLVPSYTANSILGGVPVLGKLIVGKKGEGMFALNYSVKGPFDKTLVTVNPLSALTPGFLRRIFDVKRDKIEDPNVADLIRQQKKDGKDGKN